MQTINSSITRTKSNVVIAVHNGQFHLDEMVAVSLLILGMDLTAVNCGVTEIWDLFKVIRTRDEAELAKADFVLDVGMEYNGVNKFDHHQKDCPVHPEGIPYASAGLVWNSVYNKVAENYAIKDIEGLKEEMNKFLLAVDANDTGKAEPDKRGVKLPSLAEVVRTFNIYPNKDLGFDLCLKFIFNYMDVLLKDIREKLEDKKIVEEAKELAIDGILVLPKFCPCWKDLCLGTDIKVALIDAGNGEWSITSALVQAGSQESKCPCPEHLRANKQLGGNEVVFIHKSGFTGKIRAKDKYKALDSAIAWVRG